MNSSLLAAEADTADEDEQRVDLKSAGEHREHVEPLERRGERAVVGRGA